ncbi:hypothetical protein BC830DRAFT_814350 [Chytriomyces sp. MP71]|nr:hypothetical protein BC830DRAFT_814350 [Chytriomyces sp. MP71]
MTTNIESQMSTYSQRLDVNPTIAAYPLFLSEPDYVEPISEYWTLHLTRELLESLPIPIQRINTHLHLLIDRSKSMGHNAFKKLVLPACDLLAQKLSPDRVDAVFFGSTVSHFPRVHASSFFRTREEVLGMKLEDGTDLLGAYRCAVETALRLVEAERREVEDALVEKAEKIVEKVTRRDAEALAKLERLNKSKRDGREAPVGFMDAEEIAVRDFKVKSQAVRKGLREPLPETVHVFVLITDGVDTFNSEEQIDSVLEEYQKKVTGANLKTLFRVISIGKNSSTRICLKFHMATQTLFQSAQAMPPVWHCSKVRVLLQDMSRS